MPSKLSDLVLSQEATNMQANLLLWGERLALHCEYFLTRANEGCLIPSIHKTVTNRSDGGYVRGVPDREMGIRPIGESPIDDIAETLCASRRFHRCKMPHPSPGAAAGSMRELF